MYYSWRELRGWHKGVDEYLGQRESSVFLFAICFNVDIQAYKQPAASLLASSFSQVTTHIRLFTEPLPMQHRLMPGNLSVAGDIVTNQFPDANKHPLFYVGIYCGISLTAALISVTGEWILFTGGIRSGEKLMYSYLLTNLKMSFSKEWCCSKACYSV